MTKQPKKNSRALRCQSILTALLTLCLLAGCTERRRMSDPVIADGDTIEVVIPEKERIEGDREFTIINADGRPTAPKASATENPTETTETDETPQQNLPQLEKPQDQQDFLEGK